MTIVEALNILANAESYAKYDLLRPYFEDAGDGKITVIFHTPATYYGMWKFDSVSELSAYINGLEAAKATAVAAARAAEAAPTEN